MANLTTAELAAAFRDATPIRGARDVERRVTLHELDDKSQTVAILTTRHDKDGKQFMASVRIVRYEPRDGSAFTSVLWIPFERAHNRRLPSIPVARYSAKALAAADTENLDLLTAEPDWLDNLDLGPHRGDLY